MRFLSCLPYFGPILWFSCFTLTCRMPCGGKYCAFCINLRWLSSVYDGHSVVLRNREKHGFSTTMRNMVYAHFLGIRKSMERCSVSLKIIPCYVLTSYSWTYKVVNWNMSCCYVNKKVFPPFHLCKKHTFNRVLCLIFISCFFTKAESFLEHRVLLER